MKDTIAPHGGKLVNRIAEDKEREALEEKTPNFKKIKLNKREISDLEMIATGGLSPLEGLMLKKDYDSVVDMMHLSKGVGGKISLIKRPRHTNFMKYRLDPS